MADGGPVGRDVAASLEAVRRDMARAPTSPLERLHALLDTTVARSARASDGKEAAARLRLGSVAAVGAQVAFYSRLAARLPADSAVCEVGFNAGHSAAVWLITNPSITMHAFDLFKTNESRRCFAVLQSLFPGRLVGHSGDSLRTVPATTLQRPCALVHVDGKHSYDNTLRDALNLVPKASPDALFLFDDQCAPTACEARLVTPAEPTLASCDLVRAGLISPVEAVISGPRGWSVFRLGRPAAWWRSASRTAPHGASRAGGAVLPCVPLCRLRWNTTAHAAVQHTRLWWANAVEEGVQKAQRRARPRDCVFTRQVASYW